MSDTTLDTDVVLALDAIEELFAPARPALDAPVPGARPGIERALDELVARRTAEGARLVVVLPSAPAPGIDDAAKDAIGRWCRQRVRENQFATDGLHRLGVRGLVPGLILLALGLLTAETLQRSSLPIDLRILGDGIAVVVAWVAIWYPLDTLFYARAPYRRANAALDAMSAMDVVLTTAAPRIAPSQDLTTIASTRDRGELVKVHDKLFIGGEWVEPATSAVIDVISPHTEEVIGRVPDASTADVDRAVAVAREAFDAGEWPRRSPEERIAAVQKFAEIYMTRLGDMAEVITEEMGSPISFSNLGQAPAAWMMCNSFIGIAQAYPWEETRTGMLGTDIIVRSEPVGVVAGIVPWNVPQFVTMSKLAPALLAGCTFVLKPAPETPLDAYLMAELLEEAGIPKGVVSILPAGREVGEHLVRHPGIDKVAFTGSTAAGRRIASICGEQLKRVSLELGGKSAAIILDDADLGATMEGLKFASLMNNGQACVAQTRVLASRERYDEVVDALSAMVGGLAVGDPSDPATEIGPLVAKRQQERVEKYIALGQEEGARVTVGGSGRPQGMDRGWYVQPTVFANASNDMRIAREEIFGPVLAVIPYDSPDDAVAIANDSEYGLAGSVWTGDVEQGLDIARRVRAGTYGVNQYTMDFVAPFGGFKASGIGREFGREGLEHYIESKSIVPLGGGVAAAG